MHSLVDPFVGRVIGGDFDIKRPIAAGGVGSVYEAVQRSTGKSRAVKLMHAWLLRDEKMRSRFIEEARIAGSLDSDHVVEVVSAGIDQEVGVPWIAMELLRGQTLADRVERQGTLSVADCREVLTQARHGLQMAHERQLVHRDLKPDNIFVADARRQGVPFTIKVLDFGIAKWVHDAREGGQNSQVIGTPSWMAPEQLSHVALINPATDVWALGLLAFWMLTGREYWLAANDEGSTVSAVLMEIVGGPRVSASERAAQLGAPIVLPTSFDEWFRRCVDLDPKRRFADAASCVDALAPVLAGVRANDPHGAAAEGFSKSAPGMPDTGELEAALERVASAVDPHRSFWTSHAATAALPERDDGSYRTGEIAKPRLTARRLETSEITTDLFASDAATRAMNPLTELLTFGLSKSLARRPVTSTGNVAQRGFPDRIQGAVRHVSLVLGVHPPASLALVTSDAATFTVESIVPPIVGVPHAWLEETGEARLRAHVTLAIARTLPVFGVLALLASPEELESARKAALALSLGGVSSSRFYRPLVPQLGPRREELARACKLAEPVSATDWWKAAEATLVRLALLCSADEESVLEAALAVPFVTGREQLERALADFSASPDFERYWHRGARQERA